MYELRLWENTAAIIGEKRIIRTVPTIFLNARNVYYSRSTRRLPPKTKREPATNITALHRRPNSTRYCFWVFVFVFVFFPRFIIFQIDKIYVAKHGGVAESPFSRNRNAEKYALSGLRSFVFFFVSVKAHDSRL